MEGIEKARITSIDIEEEMKVSYLDYAMSVIVGRALPDARDGLKPVHRRALYAMHELGNVHDKPFKKSARIVGDVIGKYHPHGDVAVYDAIVRMAQDFSLRFPLVDGQGNFGSVDGDPAAAMRYTEVRMTNLAEELLRDIDKETVDFFPNYDGTLLEPGLLPSRFPNLLVNGSSGIAVGMATNIPPHNLGEVVDALIHLVDKPETTIAELRQFIKGPDFPTAGFVYGEEGLGQAYLTGKGIIQLRARAEIEQFGADDRERIIITEIPYQVNKARLIEQIADLVRDKRIDGVSDIRDESDRDGMRIAIDLRKNEAAEVILNQLYKMTQMQTSFGIIFLALDKTQPRVFNLKELLTTFLDHREEVVKRRTRFGLARARERAHILEGLKIALENIDPIIATIKKSKDGEMAKSQLMTKFLLSEAQAKAILDMRLQRLTNLEQAKILEEHKEILATIANLEAILVDRSKTMNLITEELLEIKKRYDEKRRTEIIPETSEISIEDTIIDEPMVLTVTRSGFIKRTPLETYRSQRRGGKGVRGAVVAEEDIVSRLYITSPLNYLLTFTNKGNLYWLKVYEVPLTTKAAKGKALINMLPLREGERVKALLLVREFDLKKYILFVTEKGYVKKTSLQAFSNPRRSGIIAIQFNPGDNLIEAVVTDGESDVLVNTHRGKSIRFSEKDVREMGRGAKGVIGIRLLKGDHVVSLSLLKGTAEEKILTVTERGFGKQTPVSDYRKQRRGGTGIISIKVTQKNGPVVGSLAIAEEGEMMLITSDGQIVRMPISGISIVGRNTQGVRLIQVPTGETVVDMAFFTKEEEE